MWLTDQSLRTEYHLHNFYQTQALNGVLFIEEEFF